ncbi:MAG: hypothetical protein V4658_01290 [Bacteroidota bacterium]
MARSLLFITLLFPFCLLAQNRNEIKLLGAELDLLLKASPIGSSDAAMFNNLLAGTVGYNRFIGSRLAVGVSYHQFINFEDAEDVSVNNGTTRYDFKENAWGIDYHARYFFSEYDNDGDNTGYIQFSLNRTSLTQAYTNVTEYTGTVFGGGYFRDRSSFTRNYGITRYGINVGLIDSDVITQDLSIGCYFNTAPSSSSGYSLTDVRGVSFILSYVIGVSF